jgi:ABC-2 type transport system ATP-binding protein
MHRGRIVASGAPAELLASVGSHVVEVRVPSGAAAALAALRDAGIAGEDAFAIGTTITVPVRRAAPKRTLGAIADLGLPASSVTTRPPTLDDVYLRLTGERLAA